MGTMNGTACPVSQGTGILDSGLGDLVEEGERGAPRPNPEVVARAKRRTYTAEYKPQVLAEADAARGTGEAATIRLVIDNLNIHRRYSTR